MSDLLDVPAGCMEIAGVILVVEPEKLWVTKSGEITDIWQERGVWPNEAAAKAFLEEQAKRQGYK